MTAVQAQFASTCAVCGDRIEEGQRIRPAADLLGVRGRGAWAHVDCGVGVETGRRGRRPKPEPKVCGSCFLIQPCGCEPEPTC